MISAIRCFSWAAKNKQKHCLNTNPSICPCTAIIFSSQLLLSCQSVKHWEQNLKPHCTTQTVLYCIWDTNAKLYNRWIHHQPSLNQNTHCTVSIMIKQAFPKASLIHYNDTDNDDDFNADHNNSNNNNKTKKFKKIIIWLCKREMCFYSLS